MKTIHKFVLTTVAAVGLVVAAAAPASAYVVCNHDGDCWHTDSRFSAPGVTFDWHPDDWYFHQHWDDAHHWHDYRPDHGYWRGGVWVQL